mgnify:CR=1 FL=1
MAACRRLLTVLIVLLWAIGGIPRARGDFRCDHTGGGDGEEALVCRRPEAALVIPDAGPVDAACVPPRPSVAAGASVLDAATASGLLERTLASASVARPGSPRGPPLLA